MSPRRILLPPLIALAAVFVVAVAEPAPRKPFRAGAHVVDISPAKFPVIVNAMFTERAASRTVDPLHARALALDDGTTRLVFCVVDTCMMPRDLIERATAAASAATGVPSDHMLVCATHTHSAPSAMGCLGSRVDPEYAAMLPGKISEAIIGAVKNLQPARIGWTAVDDWDHTFNRRWIRRPDRVLNDPFGRPNVRANMHPGHESPDVTGPSGPVDPQLSMLAVQSPDGRPIALLANYSMHYYGSDLLSADYFGKFAKHVAGRIGAADGFVGMMTQGTSGDLMWMDYSAPAKNIGYDAYAKEVAQRAADAYRNIQWQDAAPLKSARRVLTLNYRVPDEQRLARSREVAAKLGGRLPQTQEEIYSLEAIALHERQKTELVLQAVRVGDFGIAAIPNEVFALTGLKLKAQSPFATTMNIELANGAEGYIPPPEQHSLGGYTTWPARTAGLEVQAEPKIVESVLGLLEEVSGKPRRAPAVDRGVYARAVLDAKPLAWWRLDEMAGSKARDDAGHGRDATMENGFAWYLPGADGRTGHQPAQPPAPNAFSGSRINRAVHFAGGRLRADLPLTGDFSVEFWLWNGLPVDARPITGYLISRGPDGDKAARGEHLGIAGTYRGDDGNGPDLRGRLFLFNGNERKQILAGRTALALRAWHHVVFVREGGKVRVHLDGRVEPDISGAFAHTIPAGDHNFFAGGRNDGLFNFEGKLDEVSVHSRALTPDEIAAHYKASGLKPPVPAVAAAAATPAPESPPLSPLESMKKIHVTNGYGFELVASEPQIADPVAIDWDLAGRLWVVEMADYPMGMDGKGKPGGRVRVLEDADGDGRYDKSTLFADGLSFPTGLLTWRDGVIVTAAPEVLFLKDTDNDGKADSTEKLISGLSEGNQQLRANGLRWGLDNRVYCAAGGHHGGHAADTVLRSHRDKQDIKVGSRDFSFDPDHGYVRPESGPSQFGRNRDDAGHWFGTQNSRALWHFVLPDHYLERNPHVPAPNPTHLIVTPLNAPVYPVSAPEKRFHSFENAGHYTSACSGMIYRDELLFPRRDNELDAFTCEPFHNLVQHNILVEDGVTWKAMRASGEEKHEFFASEDRWCRPVMVRTGPDGALWIVDMYRYMIEHPDWLPENGKAELLPHYRLGEDKGRIYRVFRTGKPPRKVQRLDKLGPVQLIEALDFPNAWQRDKAQMAFRWWYHRGSPREHTPDEEKELSDIFRTFEQRLKHPNPLTRLSTLSLMCGTDMIHPSVFRLFSDPDPDVRSYAIEEVKRFAPDSVIESTLALADDSDPKVRLQFVLSAGGWRVGVPGNNEEARLAAHRKVGIAIARVAINDHANPWIRAAVMSSAGPYCRTLCEGIAAAGGNAFAAYVDGLITVALEQKDRSALAAILRPALTEKAGVFTAEQLSRLVRIVDALWQRRTHLAALASEPDELTEVLKTADAMLAFARTSAADEAADAGLRVASAALLTRNSNERHGALQLLSGWLKPGRNAALQSGAVRVLASSADNAVPDILLAEFNSLSPSTRTEAVDALLSREAWATELLTTLKIRSGISLDVVQRARLLKHPSKEIRELAAAVLKAESSRKEVLEQFRPALQLKGDAERGKFVFSTRCIACHKVDSVGIDIGPDLKSVAAHPPEKILTNIIDPSLDVQPGFFAFQAKLKDGSEIYGLVTSETGNSVTFKLTDGSTRLVARGDLADFKSTGQSLMPAGLEAGISAQDMADLIALLRADTGIAPAGAGTAPARPAPAATGNLRVGAATVNFQCDETMPLAGSLESRFTKEQEGELRAVAVVVEKPGAGKVAMVACDVLWVTRSIVDPAVAEMERTTGIPAAHILVNATHTHSAPGTAPAHLFGWSEKFADEVRRGIVRSVQEANARLADAGFYFHLGEERTVGANSRLLLRDGSISWLNPAAEAGLRVEPTGPFDPQLPVLDFRAPDGKTRALLYNHSTHTIGTRSGRDVRSPSFYGLAAQELEAELGGVVEFIEGASGSTHNIRGVPVPLAIERMKRAVLDARAQAAPRPVARVAALKRPFSYRVRTFDEAAEDANVVRYAETYAKANAARIRDIFAGARRVIGPKSGEERTTWLQVMVIGDVAFVGVPAEYFTSLGLDIKRRSPFKFTYVAELANDWIGYLPDKDGHARGGYQTWTGLHSYAEAGTGERMADEAVKILGELAAAAR